MSEDTAVIRSPERSHTRASFLRKAGIGGAAVVGGSALLGSGAGVARAGDPGDGVSDVDVLNFALTLEYFEASFYTTALGGSGTTGVPASSVTIGRGEITGSSTFAGLGGRIRSDAYGLLLTIRDHEIAHVDFLRSALGASAVPPCTFNFAPALGSVETFLATAQLLENTGVMAYDGAIRYVDKGDYLQAGAQIATVEARHAAYLNLINGDSPFPNAFDMGKLPSQIIAAVKGTGLLVSCPPVVLALFSRLP